MKSVDLGWVCAFADLLEFDYYDKEIIEAAAASKG